MADEQEQALEAALARTEADADAVLKVASTATKALKRFHTAAHVGNLRDLRTTISAAEQAIDALRRQFDTAKAGWDFDEQAYFANGAFLREVLETARRMNVRVYEQDELLYSYPSLIRVVPNDRAVLIDKTRERRLRPSVLVAHLRDLQQRPPRFRDADFLEALYEAYKVKVAQDKGKDQIAQGPVVRLRDIYHLLTLLPGRSKEYTIQEFVRDRYLLDQSGVNRTKDGAAMYSADSSGTRPSAGSIRVVTQRGEEKVYYGISFLKDGQAGGGGT